MPTKEPALSEIEISNGILAPEQGAQEKVSFTGTSGQSAAFKTDIITVFATQNCWLLFGSSPTAASDDGNSTYLPSGVMRAYRVKRGHKLAVIRDASSGDLHINGGA